jgi:hypothetical protein
LAEETFGSDKTWSQVNPFSDLFPANSFGFSTTSFYASMSIVCLVCLGCRNLSPVAVPCCALNFPRCFSSIQHLFLNSGVTLFELIRVLCGLVCVCSFWPAGNANRLHLMPAVSNIVCTGASSTSNRLDHETLGVWSLCAYL